MTAADIPTEALQAAAAALAANYEPIPGYDGTWNEFQARRVLAAAAPWLIAEGRRQAAADIRAAVGTESWHGRHTAEWAARVAEGTPR